MSEKFYTLFFKISTGAVVAFAGFVGLLLITLMTTPQQAPWWLMTLFFISLLLFVLGLTQVAYHLACKYIRQEICQEIALPEILVWTASIVGLVFLHSLGILRWWNVLLIILVNALLESHLRIKVESS